MVYPRHVTSTAPATFRQVRLHALEVACRMLADLGRYGDAVAAGLAL
jgi:hypothetical protein